MDAELARSVLALFVDIATPSLDGQAMLDKVASVRRLLNCGTTTVIDIKQQMVVLNGEAATVSDQLLAAETVDSSMILRRMVIRAVRMLPPEPLDSGRYDFGDFFQTVRLKLRRGYAVKRDYCLATQATPGAKSVDETEFHKWELDGEVPAWGFTQIEMLKWPPRVCRIRSRIWLPCELESLVTFHKEDQTRTYKVLAMMLEKLYDRPFTEQMVRAQLYRRRRDGEAPHRRKAALPALAAA